MYDIHTHLYWKSYDSDRDEVLRRAHDAGVEKMFVIGTTVEESRQAVALAEKYPELFSSVGIHPHTFNEAGTSDLQSWIETLRKYFQSSKKIIAIGECGLDYHSHDPEKNISKEQRMDQEVGFLAQLELARELQVPTIIHCRDAYERMFEILKEQNSRFNIQNSFFVLHCYMGDTEVTKQFLTLPNVYFSFTANITYPVKHEIRNTKYDIQDTVKLVPLDRIFAETDCPFLAPQEHRGERNEPAFVRSVLSKISTLHGVEESAAEAIISDSQKHVFGV